QASVTPVKRVQHVIHWRTPCAREDGNICRPVLSRHGLRDVADPVRAPRRTRSRTNRFPAPGRSAPSESSPPPVEKVRQRIDDGRMAIKRAGTAMLELSVEDCLT